MRICFFSHGSQTNQDGASLSMINVILELAQRGHEIIVFVAFDRNIEELKNNKSVRVYIQPSYNMRISLHETNKKTQMKFVIKNILNNTYWFNNALKIIKKEKPDIIHINGLNNGIGALVARKLRIPYVWHIRQLMEDDLAQTLFNKNQVYDLVQKANCVIGISNAVKAKFESIVHREIVVVYNGVPIEDYALPNHHILENHDVRILLAGRVAEGKGHMEAVSAMQELVEQGIQNCKLLIVGHNQGHFGDSIQEYVLSNQLQQWIEFHEHISDLRGLRSTCDIGLLCSKKEAFGRVTIETQLSKMLFIGTNTGATAEIIHDRINGLLYQQGDSHDLAEKIKWVIAHPEKAGRIANVGYKEAYDTYSIQNVVDRLETIYRKIL